MTTPEVEINKDEIIRATLQPEQVEEVVEEKIDVQLTESQLNTIIVSLGLLPMEEIIEDAKEDYELEADKLAPNHEVYNYLLDLNKSINLKGDTTPQEEDVNDEAL